MKKISRDSQKSKVYAWESSNLWDTVLEKTGKKKGYKWVPVTKPEFRLTECQCQDVVEQMVRWFYTANINGLVSPKDIPKVVFNKRGLASYLNPREQLIKVHRNHMNVYILAHEVAHLVTAGYEVGGAHGSLFMRHFIELLVRFAKLNLKELETSTREARVKVAPRMQSRRVKYKKNRRSAAA